MNDNNFIWKHLDEGYKTLKTSTEQEFSRPHSNTDRLYMNVGENDLIEVSHPIPQDEDFKR